MSYNVLSGAVSTPDSHQVELTGAFSGSYIGDGTNLANVAHFGQSTPGGSGDDRVPFFTGGPNSDGHKDLKGNSTFTFDNGNNRLTLSKLTMTGLAAGTATTSSFLALNASNQVVLTSSAGGGGGAGTAIGAAEDGDYTDGLFTDFTTSTLVGVPIDRFNEVLKILAPSPAPNVNEIDEQATDGVTAKLSFGSSFPVGDYTSSATAAGFDAVDRSGSYSVTTSGSNIRLGVYDGTEDIYGIINPSVTLSQTNGNTAFTADAFGNANEGTLKLELNGTVVHSINLATFTGAGQPPNGTDNTGVNGNGSGFYNVSVASSSVDGNGAEWYIFKYRTAKYIIKPADQKVGWNYLRVIHSLSSDNTTNFVEWINDPSGAVNVEEMSASNGRIEDISLVGSKYLSGVEYNTDVTANYKVDLLNLYTNVYAASGNPISFGVTNSSTPSAQSVPDIGVSETANKILGVTGSLDYNSNSLLSGSITANVSVTHPLKQTISNTGSATTGNGFLIDNRTLTSNNGTENFHDESFRKTSGSYDTQGAVDAAASIWDSENHMTGGGAAGHTDGLLFFNQRLYSPIDGDIPAGGDFSSLINVETGQPDYSVISGQRTFYRVITSSTSQAFNARIQSNKVGTTYNNSALGASNAHFFIKVPGTTGWMDISQNFTYGNIDDNDGAKVAGTDADTYVSFGTASVAHNDKVMVKIIADASWSGYINQLVFTVPAVTSQAAAPALDDIDAVDAGVDAKLSFGASNGIGGYSNATVSSIGGSNIDSNGAYARSGDRLGVFSAATIVNGTLNQDVAGASGYVNDSFFNGFSGSLILEVNGSDVHEVVISGTLNAISNDFNGNSSGFDLSAVDFSTVSSVPDYTKPYRTGTYQIGTADQRTGWNYARVKHGSTTTNYIEWVIDPSGAVDNTAVSTPTLSNFDHATIYYQSGIGYFSAAPSGTFDFSGSNFYSNVYSDSSTAIRFPTTTNTSITNIRITGSGVTTFDSAVSTTGMPALNNTADCELTDIQITGSVLYNGTTPSISGGLGLFTDYDVTVGGQIRNHPFKTDRTTTSASKTSFMIYSGSIGSTNSGSLEYFNTEDYRIVSGNYVSQSASPSDIPFDPPSAYAWNPQTHMNAANAHGDGMVTVNGFAISPLQIGNDGDTRNVADGGSLQAAAGNPNYSTLSDNVRTYYRYFRNQTGLAKPTFTIKLYGDANLISKSGAFYTGTLGANKNIQVELKVPFDPLYTGGDDTSTAWADCIRPFNAGTQPDTDGVGIFNGGGSDLTQTVDNINGREIPLQLQAKQVRHHQYFVVKISAHKDWTGYLSRIEIIY